MPTPTAHYGFLKPTVGGDNDNWGGELNQTLDDLDTLIYGLDPGAGYGRLPVLVAPSVSDLIAIVDVTDFSGSPSGTLKSTTLEALLSTGLPITASAVIAKGRPWHDVTAYGADPLGVADSTGAFIAAHTAAQATGFRCIYAPAGQYKITNVVTFGFGIDFIGEGMSCTTLMHTPTAAGVCLKISNGAAVSYYNKLSDFAIYGNDVTYTKTAIQLNDISSCHVSRIQVWGALIGIPAAAFYGGGTGSKCIEIKGREASSFNDLKLVGQLPIFVDANPNVASRGDNEDLDHFNFHCCHLQAPAGHYLFTLNDGIGFSHLSITGYSPWVGGSGGLYINDTRTGAGNIDSRNLLVEGVRGEQGQNGAGWWFNIRESTGGGIQQVRLVNVLGDSTMNFMQTTGVVNLSLVNTTAATPVGKTALSVTNPAGGATIILDGFYASVGAAITLPSFTATLIESFDTNLFACPTKATYVVTGGQRHASYNGGAVVATTVAGTTALTITALVGDAMRVIPNAAGSGVQIRFEVGNLNDFSAAQLYFSELDFLYRTGVNTSAFAMRVDNTGNLRLRGGALLVRTNSALTDASGGSAGTLTNAPSVGNPVKWITIDDFGTNRRIPTW